MKIFLLSTALALSLSLLTFGQQNVSGQQQTLLNAVTVDGDGTVIQTERWNAIRVRVTIAGTATVTFKVQTDGTNWDTTANSYNITAPTTAVSTATSTGSFIIVTGGAAFKPVVSGCSSCTVTFKARPFYSTSAKAVSGGGAGGGSGDALVANPLSQFASTTSAELASTISNETGTTLLVYNTSPTLVTPILGTPTSVTLTNGTGLPISTGVSGLGTGVATFLATPSSANIAAAVTGETGTGALVFGTSPDFTTGITIGSVAVPTISSTNILTNKSVALGTNTITGTLAELNTAITDADIARTDAANTFTGVQTMTSPSFTTSLVTGSSTFALLNTTATTVNAFGATTALNIGASATLILNFGGSTTASEFRFLEPSGSGTNYTAFKAVAQGANVTYSLPPDDGNSGELLRTDGSGVLTWVAASGTGDVTAASNFGTDNVILRSDGTGKGAQPTGITIADTTNDLSSNGGASFGVGSGNGGALTLAEGTAPTLVGDAVTHYAIAAIASGGTKYGWGATAGSGILRVANTSGDMLVTQDAGVSHLAASSSADLRGVLSDESGTGAALFAGGALGAATATSINGLTISTTTGTLTLANSSSIITSGGNAITFTSTGTTGVTLPTTGTLSTLAGAETFTGKTITNPAITTQTLTDGATVNWDANSGNIAVLTLGGNRTMAAPTNLKTGGTYALRVNQDGTGSRTITWNSVFKWSGATAPTLTTTASRADLITCISTDGTNLLCSSILDVR